MEGIQVGWEKPGPLRDRQRGRAPGKTGWASLFGGQHRMHSQDRTSLPTKLTTLVLGTLLAVPNTFALVRES